MNKYQTISADPPWYMPEHGKRQDRPNRKVKPPYPLMEVAEICNLPIGDLAGFGCHLWLWVTNNNLENAFRVIRAWGFKYNTTITWVKPSGYGFWFVQRTQHLLFAYKDKCIFNGERYKPTIFYYTPNKHSQKPSASYDLIESISDEPRLELFARRKRLGWDCWGNEVESDIDLTKYSPKNT